MLSVPTLSVVPTADLFLQGVTIRLDDAADDTVSTSFASGSAIAKAAAINDAKQFTGVEVHERS